MLQKIHDLFCRFKGTEALLCCRTADNGHADGNGFAVRNGVVTACFNAVAHRVAKIQLHAAAGVEFVLSYHIPFQFHTTGDDSFTVKGKAMLLQVSKELRIVQYAVLDNLCAAIPENIRRSRVSIRPPP